MGNFDRCYKPGDLQANHWSSRSENRRKAIWTMPWNLQHPQHHHDQQPCGEMPLSRRKDMLHNYQVQCLPAHSYLWEKYCSKKLWRSSLWYKEGGLDRHREVCSPTVHRGDTLPDTYQRSGVDL